MLPPPNGATWLHGSRWRNVLFHKVKFRLRRPHLGGKIKKKAWCRKLISDKQVVGYLGFKISINSHAYIR